MAISGILGVVAPLITSVIERLWPDATEAEKVKLEALKTAVASELAIHATNQEEAKHPSIFVAGWRPFVGWVCGLGLAYAFLLQPLFHWLSAVAAVYLDTQVPVPPALDLSVLITMLGGMLGFGAYRTYEGIKGVKRDTWRDKDG